MATTLPGGGGTDVILPEGVSTESVEVAVSEEGNTLVAIKKNTKDVNIAAKGSTAVTGKKITDSSVTVVADKGETANIVLETTVANGTTITNEGKSSIEVNLNTGKVRDLKIDAGNKKRADLVRVKDDVKLSRFVADMGKGDDTLRFGKGVKFKGTSSIDLGKGGKDSVVIEADSIGKAKLTITNFTKKDELTIGKTTFDYKDIKGGADLPGNIKVELA